MSKDGGPAFPNKQSVDYDIRCKCGAMVKFDSVTHPGLSLRDYFAAAALTGFIANNRATEEWMNKFVVASAYHIADSMLAQRDK